MSKHWDGFLSYCISPGPARSNLEETLSTLDYALCAKSIKNKLELNQLLHVMPHTCNVLPLPYLLLNHPQNPPLFKLY